jgi:hypothetical protein
VRREAPRWDDVDSENDFKAAVSNLAPFVLTKMDPSGMTHTAAKVTGMIALTGLLNVVITCKSSLREAREGVDFPQSWEGHTDYSCEENPPRSCRVERASRITEKDWPPAVFEQVLARSGGGTMAVDRSDGTTKLVPSCHLPGSYTEVKGAPGRGRFWATDRPIIVADEVGADCRAATHVVAAFATTPPPANDSAFRVEAILIPLPCPATSESAPSEGCVGRGLTGEERLQRARELRKKNRHADAGLSSHVEAYALAPNDRFSIDNLETSPYVDCFLAEQIGLINATVSHGGRVLDGWNKFDEQDDCRVRPPFLNCFPDLFEPARTDRQCWISAAAGAR